MSHGDKFMKNIIRPAEVSDLPEIRRIYDAAKLYMNKTGNPNQWNVGYPPDKMLKNDIENHQLYVVKDINIGGVFALIPGIDPTYIEIDGAWLRDHEYAAIHRVASDGHLRGVLASAVEFAREKYPELDLRIDTHHENHIMQAAIKRLNFVECGIIHLQNGDPRVAFQLICES